MRSVNTPATPMTRATSALGLATFSPARTQSYLPSYVGKHPATYGVCQHAGYSYDTCDLTSISHCPLWAWLHSHQPFNCSLWAWLHSHQPSRHCKLTFNPFLYLYTSTITYNHLFRPSNGPNLANPENTRYAISVRDSNGIKIEIRSHIRARDIEGIALGQKFPSATVPTNRHTRRQRVGVQSDITSPENFQIKSQDSYPR
ncbi:unnamed protein product [Prunus brigantina]